MLFEALRFLNGVLTLLGAVRYPFVTLVIQPLLTVTMLLGLYSGWHIRDEGSLVAGLRVAFIDTRANREVEQQALVAALMQAELHQYATSGKLIDELLGVVLLHSGGAARVRLGVVHNGVSGLTGTSMLRYDVTNAVASPGRAAGETVVNEPLSTWSEFLPALLAGKCQLIALADVHNFGLQGRLRTLGANSLLSCPVTDVEGKLLGALFSNWDAADQPPAGDELKALMDFDQRIGGQIASVLSVRSRLDLPLAAAGK
ncbi:MAG: hypothetical protein ABSC95_07880 [Acetobacteraceae bacterium]